MYKVHFSVEFENIHSLELAQELLSKLFKITESVSVYQGKDKKDIFRSLAKSNISDED